MRSLAPWLLIFFGLAGGCDGANGILPPPEHPAQPWTWEPLGGPEAEVPEQVSNHETLVVLGDTVLLGTGDGVWQRPLVEPGIWQQSGLAGLSVHALALAADGERIVAVGIDPVDGGAPTAWYSTDGGLVWTQVVSGILHWTPAAGWPRGQPGSPFAGQSFPFYSLEPDPSESGVFYGGLEADTLAVTVDGGATWVMTDGATEPNFGYPCVHHRPADVAVLLQGCELPLDIAWVGARDVIPEDRFSLPNQRMLFGGSEAIDELENRRVNAMAPVESRSDRVLVGVEGGLLELTSASGEWLDRADTTGRWILKVELDAASADFPYTYVRAIAPLDEDGEHILFGGTINGFNEVLSLYETFDAGADVQRLNAPIPLHDPRVEQAWVLESDEVLLVISVIEPGQPATASRAPMVFRLTRAGVGPQQVVVSME